MATIQSPESEYCDFYLIRHLEAEKPAIGKVLCGGSAPLSEFDTGLSKKGQEQLQILAEKVVNLPKPAAIFSSPFQRTLQTILPIAEKLGLPLQSAQNALNELNHGEFVGMKTEEWKNHPSWKAYCEIAGKDNSKLVRIEKLISQQAQGAETNCEVINRTSQFFFAVAPQFYGKTVFCCTSDGAMRSLKNRESIERIYGLLGTKSSTEAVKELLSRNRETKIEEANHFGNGDILHIRVNARTQEIRILETISLFSKAHAEKEEA